MIFSLVKRPNLAKWVSSIIVAYFGAKKLHGLHYAKVHYTKVKLSLSITDKGQLQKKSLNF